METRKAERRVVDVSQTARLTEGWGNDDWAVRGDNDCVTVTVRIPKDDKQKFFEWVSVKLTMTADQVRKLARVAHVDEQIITDWVDNNSRTARSPIERDGAIRDLTEVIDDLTVVVESQRRKLNAIEKALGEV